jgi:glycosyltransferase involved in cell wall biosynthesis
MRLAVVSHPCLLAVNRQVYVELRRRGVDVIIIAPREIAGSPADPRGPAEPDVRFLPLTSNNPRTYWFEGAEAVLSEFRPDAILIEADPVSWLAVSLGRWARARGVKCLCLSVDNLDFGLVPHLHRTGLASLPQVLVKNSLHMAARRRIDIVFTISTDGATVFRKRGYRKVIQVPLGFDPNLFHVDPVARERTRHRLGLTEEAVTFAYFGRVVPQKGVHLIVDALARLDRALPEERGWRFLLDRFEPDAYSRRIEGLIDEKELSSRVIRFEARHNEMPDYMRAADVVLLASLTTPTSVEQYGRVIPEAMACGALAIVSDSGMPKDIVGDCGLVLPEGDVDRLTASLSNVLLNPGRYAGIRAAGAEHARLHCSVQRQADIYHDALCGSLRRCVS